MWILLKESNYGFILVLQGHCFFKKFKMAAKIATKSRSNMFFQQMKLETSLIPHFPVVLTGQSNSNFFLNIQGHLHGQKVNFKIK